MLKQVLNERGTENVERIAKITDKTSEKWLQMSNQMAANEFKIPDA